MAFCHGNGDPDHDGCCHIEGQPCALRIKLVNGRVLRGPDLVDLGTVTDYVRGHAPPGNARARLTAQLQGVTYACSAALRVIVADPSALDDRQRFEAGWHADDGYVEFVAPRWREIEERYELVPGSLDCAPWDGEGGKQCCFGEPPEVNEARAAGLSVAAVRVRRARGQ